MPKKGGSIGGSGVGVVGVSGAGEEALRKGWEGLVAIGVALGGG